MPYSGSDFDIGVAREHGHAVRRRRGDRTSPAQMPRNIPVSARRARRRSRGGRADGRSERRGTMHRRRTGTSTRRLRLRGQLERHRHRHACHRGQRRRVVLVRVLLAARQRQRGDGGVLRVREGVEVRRLLWVQGMEDGGRRRQGRAVDRRAGGGCLRQGRARHRGRHFPDYGWRRLNCPRGSWRCRSTSRKRHQSCARCMKRGSRHRVRDGWRWDRWTRMAGLNGREHPQR